MTRSRKISDIDRMFGRGAAKKRFAQAWYEMEARKAAQGNTTASKEPTPKPAIKAQTTQAKLTAREGKGE